MYEFLDKKEREEADKKTAEQVNDIIEQKKEKENIDWAIEEEKRELAELAKNKGLVSKEDANKIMDDNLSIDFSDNGADLENGDQ